MNKFNYFKTIFFILSLCIITAITTYYFATKHANNCNNNNKNVVTKLILDVWSKGQLELLTDLVSTKYTIKHDAGDPWEGKTVDLTTLKERVKLSRHVFPDQQFYIEDMVCSGDKVAVSWRFTGTQDGNIGDLPPTHKHVTVTGITIYYLSHGKVTGHWQVFDRLGLIQQLGGKIGQ